MRDVPASEVMRFGEVPVCSECKPAAVAKLASGKVLGKFWRKQSRFMVVRTDERIEFPACCVFCGKPAEAHWLGQSLTVLPRFVAWTGFVLIMLGVLVFVAPLFVTRLPVTLLNRWFLLVPFAILLVMIGLSSGKYWRHSLCETHWRERERYDQLQWITTSLIFAPLIAIFLKNDWLITAAFVAVIAWMVFRFITRRDVSFQRHTPQFFFFKGCGAAFLDKFPEWPGER